MKTFFTLLLFLAGLTANPFYTAIGTCRLDFVSDDIQTIRMLENDIKNDLREFVLEFGSVPIQPLEVIVAPSEQSFKKLTRGYAPEWSAGVAIRKLNRVVIKSPDIAPFGLTRLREILQHELNHIYMYRIPGMDEVPAWYLEGLAMRAAGELSLSQRISISAARWQGKLFALSQLTYFGVRQNHDVNLAYAQAAAAVIAMEEIYGGDIHKTLLNLMRSGTPFEDAFFLLTDNDLLDFQERYGKFLKQNYSWLFLIQAPRLLYIALPVILVIGFVIKWRVGRQKKRLWEIEEELQQYQNDNDPQAWA